MNNEPSTSQSLLNIPSVELQQWCLLAFLNSPYFSGKQVHVHSKQPQAAKTGMLSRHILKKNTFQKQEIRSASQCSGGYIQPRVRHGWAVSVAVFMSFLSLRSCVGFKPALISDTACALAGIVIRNTLKPWWCPFLYREAFKSGAALLRCMDWPCGLLYIHRLMQNCTHLHCITQGMSGLCQFGAHVHSYLATPAGMAVKTAYGKYSTLRKRSCSQWCEKKQLMTSRVSEKNRGRLHSAESAVLFVPEGGCGCKRMAIPNRGGK